MTQRLPGTQVAPVVGIEGSGTQCPSMTQALDAHTTPHAPQALGSDAVLEQAPPQQTPSTTRGKDPGPATFPKRQATPETPA